MRHVCAVVFWLAVGFVPALAQDGTVVVFRPSKFIGSALKPSVYVDGNQAARLENGRYVSLQLSPGKHNFESSMKKTGALEVDVKPKETVYLEMVILPGNWRGGGRLVPAAEDDAKMAILKLKPSDAKVATVETSAVQSQPEPPLPDNSQPKPNVEYGASEQPATVTVKSTPSGADINVNGKFMGNTPSTIQLPAGEHKSQSRRTA